MAPPLPTLGDIQAAAITGLVLGTLTTGYRVYDRIRGRRFWWDDAAACASMLVFFVFFGSLTVHLQNPVGLPRDQTVAIYYLVALDYYLIVWLVRISIMFSVVRISPNERDKKYLRYIIGLFVILWAFQLCQIIYVCEQVDKVWKDTVLGQCDLGDSVAIAQIISVIIADVLLILAPIRVLWQVQVERALRVRLIALFATSIVMTAVSVVRTAYVLEKHPIEEAMTATVEDSVSQFVCNASVIFSAVYRVVRKFQGEDVSDLTGRSGQRSGAKSGAFATATIGGTRMNAKSQHQSSNRQWQSQTDDWAVKSTPLAIPMTTKQDSFLDMQRNSAYEQTHKVDLEHHTHDNRSWNSSDQSRIDKVGEASFIMYTPGKGDRI